jgi:hypothetical protein
MAFRIGELLKQRGLLDDVQIEEILARQLTTGMPFGAVAAELFGVQEAELWRAWAQQMIECCPRVYPAEIRVNKTALAFLTPREAWAYRLLPIDISDDDVTLVTAAERLPNAMAFAQIKSAAPVIFCVAERDELETALRNAYHLDASTLAA